MSKKNSNVAESKGTVEQVKKENRVFVLVDGKEMPRKEYVVQEFKKDRKRQEIANELGVPVQIVFGYTKGMENKHHKPGVGGFGRSAATVKDPETGQEMPRNAYIKKQFDAGKSRGEIAKELECSYQVVYNATKKPKAKDNEAAPEAVSALNDGEFPSEL